MLKLFRNDQNFIDSVKNSSEIPVNVNFIPRNLHFLLSECDVLPGSDVCVGQILGTTPDSRQVACGVSGKISDISKISEDLFSVIVESDDLMSVCPQDVPFGKRNPIKITDLSCELLLKEIERALVNTRLKTLSFADRTIVQRITDSVGKAKQIVISCVSCDPYDSSFERIIEEYPDDILSGMKILMAALKIGEGVIVVDTENKDRVQRLVGAIKPSDNIKVVLADIKYPSDNEHMILNALTSIELSGDKNAERLACAVFDGREVLSVARAFLSGKKETGEITTVVGENGGFSLNVQVPYGTRLAELAELCGIDPSDPDIRVSVGGMLRGREASVEECFVPGMAPVVFLSSRHIPSFDGKRCLRCGKCVEACPMFLMPNYIYFACSIKNKSLAERFDIASCIECGACQYVCVGEIPLLAYIRSVKNDKTEDSTNE